MMKRDRLIILYIIIAVLIIIYNSLFIVEQTHQAIVLQFGELKKVHLEPGLKLKIPFIQEIFYYEKRFLSFDRLPIHLTTGDQKRLVVDTYTRYRIEDPLVFFKTVKPASELGAAMRLEAIVGSAVRNVLGKVPLRKLLSDERSNVMEEIEQLVVKTAKPLGISVVDVRIIRTELPKANRDAVFARMNSELIRFAKKNRAEGAQDAQITCAKTDKEKEILIAQAHKDGKILIAEGEAEALDIMNRSISKDIDFYAFCKTMQIYRDTLTGKTTLLLSTDTPILNFLANNINDKK
ncbi:MAG: protease modulator HflC [Alphaproteobacteria bacterium]